MNNWIKAHAFVYNRDFTQAVNTLKQLDERTMLRGNHSVLVTLGEVYYYMGDTAKAATTLLRVSR